MASYRGFAPVYDALMADQPYEARAAYLLGLFRKWGKEPHLMLDLACGSGRLTLEMARLGVDMIGVDRSVEMLTLARERLQEFGCLLLCQSAEELDLYGTVDSAVCTMDSINHITDEETLYKVFERVHLFLEPSGLFLFDVNSVSKHAAILANNTFEYDTGDVYCLWHNKTEMPFTTLELDYSVRVGGEYFRGNETFRERAWSQEELESLLNQSGFTLLARYDDMTHEPPAEESDRIQYVVRRD